MMRIGGIELVIVVFQTQTFAETLWGIVLALLSKISGNFA